jgi:hypothetical protein
MLADNDRMLQAEKECVKAIECMEQMVSGVAMARQIVGLRDDRVKKALSVLVAEYLKNGDSAAGAEWKARADARFESAARDILNQTSEAAQSLLRWDIQKLKFENAQALRNDERARMKIL